MRSIITVLLAMVFTLGTGSICSAMDSVHPDLSKASNCKKGDKIMNVLEKAEQKIAKAFPEYSIYGEWRVSQHGYHRTFTKGQGRNQRSVELIVSHDGGVYFQTDIGDTVAMR